MKNVGDHGTGGSGAPPATYDGEASANQQVSKEDLADEKQKEDKTKVVEQTFYQKHKVCIIFTGILAVLTVIGFAIGFGIEIRSPENLPP